MGYIVVICLVFSVIESQLILPSHLAHRRVEPRAGRPNAFVARWLKFQERLSIGIENFAERRYGEALSHVLEWRYLTLAVGIGVLTVVAAPVVSGRRSHMRVLIAARPVVALLSTARIALAAPESRHMINAPGTPFPHTSPKMKQIRPSFFLIQS